MNLFDLLAAVAIGFGLIRGITRGLIMEVVAMVGLLVGIWAGMRLAFIFADYYKNNSQIPGNFVPFLAFLTAFAVGMGGVWLVGKLLTTAADGVELTLPNKIAGGILGAAKWAFILGTFLSVLGHSQMVPKETQNGSATYPYLMAYCENVNEYSIALLPYARNVFTDMDVYFKGLDSIRTEKGDSNLTLAYP